MDIAKLIDRRNQLLGTGTALFYTEPLNIVRGEGVWLFDADGNQYMDLYNNVPCVGHANPHVVEAMHRQTRALNVHSRYLHEGILDYAEQLLGHHHDHLTSVVFACSGTEANEVALMMARFATGGRGIICTDGAYHGNSTEVRKLSRAAASNTAADREVRAIPFPQCYRSIREGASQEKLRDLYLDEVRSAIDAFVDSGVGFAGMLLCPILANEGLPDIPSGFMAGAAELVRKNGGLFICDEVQAGLCRSSRWWGYELMNFVPDIVSMGKPLGNGMPLSAVAAATELVNNFRSKTRYFNTFASSPLQAAAGMAVLDVLEKDNLVASAAAIGDSMRAELRKIQPSCEAMGDVRGHGLFVGIEWVRDRESKTPDREGAIKIVNKLKDKGFLLSNAGALGNVLKVRPPLVFAQQHADLFLTAFAETLQELEQ